MSTISTLQSSFCLLKLKMNLLNLFLGRKQLPWNKQTRTVEALSRYCQQYVSVMIGVVFHRSGAMKLTTMLLLATGGMIANLFLTLLFRISIVHWQLLVFFVLSTTLLYCNAILQLVCLSWNRLIVHEQWRPPFTLRTSGQQCTFLWKSLPFWRLVNYVNMY